MVSKGMKQNITWWNHRLGPKNRGIKDFPRERNIRDVERFRTLRYDGVWWRLNFPWTNRFGIWFECWGHYHQKNANPQWGSIKKYTALSTYGRWKSSPLRQAPGPEGKATGKGVMKSAPKTTPKAARSVSLGDQLHPLLLGYPLVN